MSHEEEQLRLAGVTLGMSEVRGPDGRVEVTLTTTVAPPPGDGTCPNQEDTNRSTDGGC